MKGGGFSAPGDYIYFKSQVPLHKIPIGSKQWRYYDFGPKVVPPLICLPGVAGTADVYYKQIMSLSMKDMVVGGTDTTSNTIEFAMAELLNKPEIMKKAQQELDMVIGKDNVVVDEKHIYKLPYLTAIMKEVLRLHPVLPLMVPHCPSETSIIAGYKIPKGTAIFINVWAIHRDPSIWEDPLEFKPERFLDSTKGDYSGKDFGYIPFGSGRRICAGMAMAERVVLFSLASLLHLFDWKLAGDGKVDLTEKFGIVLSKKMPLLAIPTPRLSKLDLYK